jgi:hypothetical protein
MNDFASALSTALREEAKEIAMSADMQHAERELQENIRTVDRRRRVWIAVAAAAALVVVAAGITVAIKVPTSEPSNPNPTTGQPTAPAQSTITFNGNALSPPMTVQLPHWIASAQDSLWAGGYAYDQSGSGTRSIKLFSVDYMYPLGAARIAAHPTYAALVESWMAVQTKAYGTVTDVATATVGGKQATTMTVTVTRQADGFAYCDSATNLASDGNACSGLFAGRVMHVAIVDQGTSEPPTLLWESSTAADTGSPSVATEFATWLATLHHA